MFAYLSIEYLSQIEIQYHSASESCVWSGHGFFLNIVMLCPLLEETRNPLCILKWSRIEDMSILSLSMNALITVKILIL